MDKKTIKITEQELHNLIKETTMAILNTRISPINTYNNKSTDLIVEMARINKKEMGKCIFPYDTWEVKIWSNDHNPPHFHILREGWDVSFDINNGSVVSIKSQGQNKKIYEYMCANEKEWLSSTCFAQKKLTNQENALLHWDSLHDN